VSSGGPAGTRELSKLASRRDRIILPVCLYALVVGSVGTAYSLKGLFPDQASRQKFFDGIEITSGAAPLYGKMMNSTLGGIASWRLLTLFSVLAAVMSVLLVVRHTRAEEETGRQELVAAGVVDRKAPLVAAIQLVFGMNLVAGVLIGALFPFIGLSAGGAFALGLAIAGSGIFFAAVALVCAQLFESSRSANATSLSLLGFFYLVRAVGDMGDGASWLGWCSPLGWAQRVHPYAGDRWWVLALPVVGAGALIAVAVRLLDQRDFASGRLAPGLGPAYASASTRGTLGLAWRTHRGMIAGWTAGMLVGGLVLGSFVKNVQVLTDSDQVQNIMADLGGSRNMSDAFVATCMGVFGIMAAAVALNVIARARAEEADGRIELAFAGTPSRVRWLLGHVVLAVGGAVVVLAAGGFGAGLTDGLYAHDLGHTMGSVFGAAFAQLPAVLVIAGIAVLLLAAFPRYTGASWGIYGAFAFVTLIGPELNVSHYVLDVSPFSQVPKLPGASVAATPLVVMAALAVVGSAVALGVFRRRDLLA
jgi:ABC-2 type transport system permease protein